jgi:hypothetical protein
MMPRATVTGCTGTLPSQVEARAAPRPSASRRSADSHMISRHEFALDVHFCPDLELWKQVKV